MCFIFSLSIYWNRNFISRRARYPTKIDTSVVKIEALVFELLKLKVWDIGARPWDNCWVSSFKVTLSSSLSKTASQILVSNVSNFSKYSAFSWFQIMFTYLGTFDSTIIGDMCNFPNVYRLNVFLEVCMNRNFRLIFLLANMKDG